MKKLINGIIDFRRNCLSHYVENFGHLALGQTPDALLIACCDSRVVPNLFASTNPGDMFVVRNVGNLVPPFDALQAQGSAESAAIEFALHNLSVSNIIICGHSECGAMHALIAKSNLAKENPNLAAWLKLASCCLKDSKTCTNTQLAAHNRLSQQNILQQIQHLKTYPEIQRRLKEGTLTIHGWYFDIAKGDVYNFEEIENAFILIDETEAVRILNRLKEKS